MCFANNTNSLFVNTLQKLLASAVRALAIGRHFVTGGAGLSGDHVDGATYEEACGLLGMGGETSFSYLSSTVVGVCLRFVQLDEVASTGRKLVPAALVRYNNDATPSFGFGARGFQVVGKSHYQHGFRVFGPSWRSNGFMVNDRE